MKKKLLITVGAGASLDFGLPSVDAVDKLLDDHAKQLFPLAHDPERNLYSHIRDKLNAYYAQNPKEGLRKWANFEDVIYQVNVLASLFSDSEFQNGANALLRAEELPNVLRHGREVSAADSSVLIELAASMQDIIVEHFIEVCATLPDTQRENIAHLKSMLDALSDEFDIGVVTLNYDNVFSLARPDLYTGFNTVSGAFEPVAVLNRTEWNFLYHVHGSIHYAMDMTPSDMHRIEWRKTPQKGRASQASGRNGQSTAESLQFPTSVIIAGYGKTHQMLRQPFRTLFAQVNKLVLESDALLFIGYGFGDLHLNATFSEATDRRRPVAVITWGDIRNDPFQFRADAWSTNLQATVPTRARSMSGPDSTSPWSIDELKAAAEFEVSNDEDFKLAIWYDGLMSKSLDVTKLISHLRLSPLETPLD